MSKDAEVTYIENVANVHNISEEDFMKYLSGKPYSDANTSTYLMDIAQVMNYLPPRPARILDLGVGSGWTSAIFARCGYEVVGIDINPKMIDIAGEKVLPGLNLSFHTHDYEKPIPFGHFDAAVIYDALHHAEDEAEVVKQVYDILKTRGVFIILEPGKGHSHTQGSKESMEKYGTMEKDMPHTYVRGLLQQAGFQEMNHFIRLTQLPLLDLSKPFDVYQQIQQFVGLIYNTTEGGMSSLLIGKK